MIATDSEWDTALPDPWLSTQFASPTRAVVFMRRDLPRPLQNRLTREADRMGVVLRFVDRSDGTDLLAEALPHLDVKPDRGKYRLLFYFSPKDVEYALGWEPVREAIFKGRVRQHSTLTGAVGRVVLRDMMGWSEKKKLPEFAGAMGVSMPEKTCMDEYKANMSRGLTKRPEEYLRYAVDDARVLLAVYPLFVKFVRRVQREVLGMPKADLLGLNDIPITVGRLVAQIFEGWLVRQACPLTRAVEFCSRKLGFLDMDHPNYILNREVRHDLLGRVHAPEDLDRLDSDPVDRRRLRQFFKADYYVTAVSAAGVKRFAGEPPTSTAVFNALVHGGRCNNEMPDWYSIGPGLDIDISGAYGTSLRGLTYPVGVPSDWSYSPNDKRPTLGQWLARNRGNLVRGLWQVVVSGKLPFNQDLLHSKFVKLGDIRKAVGGEKIPDVFALTRREVKNAVITADVLDAIEKVATTKERKALMKLEVVTAAAYLASDRVDGPCGWVEKVLAYEDRGHHVRLAAGTSKDARPRVWYGVRLEGFVGKLVDERRRVRLITEEAGTSPALPHLSS